MSDKYYQLIKQKYQNKGNDFTELFQVILSVSDKVGRDKALGYLEKCITEKWLLWLDKDLKKLKKKENPIDAAYRIFYESFLKISVPEDGELVKKTDKKLITRWCNDCPVLKACKKLGLDTREICKKTYHKPAQVFLSRINPRLKFSRNYNHIRPYSPFCEEIITLEE